MVSLPLIPEHSAADDHAHDLVGTLKYLMHAHVAQDALDRMIAQIAIAAMQLQAAIDHLETRIGSKALGLGGKTCCGRLTLPDGDRGAMQQQPRRLEFRG